MCVCVCVCVCVYICALRCVMMSVCRGEMLCVELGNGQSTIP